MPAENVLSKTNFIQKNGLMKNIDYMRNELRSLGLSFSENQEFATSDELYTKYEQEFIIKMYEAGVLYRKSATVNCVMIVKRFWQMEQVVEGCCWRCDNEIIQKEMPGYYVAITKYAQTLMI